MSTELKETLDELVAFYGESTFYPTREQWQKVLSHEHQGKVVMLNLLKLKTEAENPYKNGEILSCFELIERYQQYSERAVKKTGGVPGFSGMVLQAFIGNGDWDIVGLVEYPSIQSFIALFQDPDYRTGYRYREAACSDHQLLIVAPV